MFQDILVMDFAMVLVYIPDMGMIMGTDDMDHTITVGWVIIIQKTDINVGLPITFYYQYN